MAVGGLSRFYFWRFDGVDGFHKARTAFDFHLGVVLGQGFFRFEARRQPPLHAVVASVGDPDPTLGIGGDAGRSQRAAEAGFLPASEPASPNWVR